MEGYKNAMVTLNSALGHTPSLHHYYSFREIWYIFCNNQYTLFYYLQHTIRDGFFHPSFLINR